VPLSGEKKNLFELLYGVGYWKPQKIPKKGEKIFFSKKKSPFFGFFEVSNNGVGVGVWSGPEKKNKSTQSKVLHFSFL
jgi:hypothetical protein